MSHDGSLRSAGESVTANNDTSVYPVIKHDGMVEPFTVGSTTYTYWTDAAKAAANGGTIILNDSYTLPATMADNGVSPAGSPYITEMNGKVNYIVPPSVTLLIPRNKEYTVDTKAPNTSDAESLTTPTAFCTLTMESGANITVNGAISIAGTQHSKMAAGTPFGPVGFIRMNSNSTITVNSGAFLYAWGYITGSGAVTIKSGGTVYESFQIADWRGGSATSAMMNKAEKIFPMSQYYVQNVEVPMTLEAGAKEYGFMSVDVTLAGIQTTEVAFVGSGDVGMFRINQGSITKDYDEENDRLVVNLNAAEMSIAPIEINIKVSLLGSVSMVSSKYVLPVTSNMTVFVNDGSSLDLSQDVAFVPGSELYIEEGGTCTVGSGCSVYIYDYDTTHWGNYCGDENAEMVAIAYAPGKKTGVKRTLKDALIQVDGTFDATNGYVYSTSAGANVFSGANGQVKIKNIGTQTVTYQATYVKDGYTAHEIPIVPVWLKNKDGNFVKTSEKGEGTYYHSAAHEKWWKDGHPETSVVTDPTCTDPGYTTHTCPCGYSHTDEFAALGHLELTTIVAANCCNTGTKTVGCDRCGETLSTETLPIDKTNHDKNAVLTPTVALSELHGIQITHNQCPYCTHHTGAVTLNGNAVTEYTSGFSLSASLSIQDHVEMTLSVLGANGQPDTTWTIVAIKLDASRAYDRELAEGESTMPRFTLLEIADPVLVTAYRTENGVTQYLAPILTSVEDYCKRVQTNSTVETLTGQGYSANYVSALQAFCRDLCDVGYHLRLYRYGTETDLATLPEFSESNDAPTELPEKLGNWAVGTATTNKSHAVTFKQNSLLIEHTLYPSVYLYLNEGAEEDYTVWFRYEDEAEWRPFTRMSDYDNTTAGTKAYVYLGEDVAPANYEKTYQVTVTAKGADPSKAEQRVSNVAQYSVVNYVVRMQGYTSLTYGPDSCKITLSEICYAIYHYGHSAKMLMTTPKTAS